MLDMKQPIYRILLILDLALVVPAILANVQAIVSAGALTVCISSALSIAALLIAAYYVIRGYSKAQAWAYKTFAALYALTLLTDLVGVGTSTDSALPICVMALTFGLLITAVCTHNNGKKASLQLCLFILLLSALSILLLAVNGEGSENAAFFIRTGCNLLLAVTYTLITRAKYVDKDARGTV